MNNLAGVLSQTLGLKSSYTRVILSSTFGPSWNGRNLIDVVMEIAYAVISSSPPSELMENGIPQEPGDPSPDNANYLNHPQFKDIFMRNLARLVAALDVTQAVR